MRLMIYIGHPAHVHFFKNAIWEWEREGHSVSVVCVQKEITKYLLDVYGIKYNEIGENTKGILNKSFGMIKKDFKVLKIARKFKPDIIMGIGNIYGSHVASLLGKKSIWFCDSEYTNLVRILTLPFADFAITPSSFRKNMGHKHIKYNGYHELAYLHPNRFNPDPSVLNDLGIDKNDRFSIVRFISWGASHDKKESGFSDKEKIIAINKLSKYGEVFITSECDIPKQIKKYKLKIPPEKIHHLLYFADLYLGEGGTMSTEAAILGTPSVRVSTISKHIGNFNELRDKYDAMYFYDHGKDALKKSVELLENNEKNNWKIKRERILNDKVDVTEWIVNFVDNINNT